jgi:dihydroorotate dehydrogenase
MSWFYRKIIRPVLFNFNSEEIHNQTLSALGRMSQSRLGLDFISTFYGAPSLPVELFGLKFPNPVGLAAGMDKQSEAVPVWEAMGFGFVELGGVTWHPQSGNPAPRMFRAIADEALVNRMGFNNPGAEIVAGRLAAWKKSGLWPNHPVGINLGKSKITPLEAAAGDYANSFRALREYADFFVVNVSSPNTPNLRELQDKDALAEIFRELQLINLRSPSPKPILVKVAPDLSFQALDEILGLTTSCKISGIVATNTTISRPETADQVLRETYSEVGGLSGKPLRARSTEIIRHLYRSSGGQVPIIGVGGILNVEDAWEKIEAGASLIQIYTGLVYEGPSLPQQIVEGLRARLEEKRLGSLPDAIGSDQRERK